MQLITVSDLVYVKIVCRLGFIGQSDTVIILDYTLDLQFRCTKRRSYFNGERLCNRHSMGHRRQLCIASAALPVLNGRPIRSAATRTPALGTPAVHSFAEKGG